MKGRNWITVGVLAALLVAVQTAASAVGRDYYLKELTTCAYHAIVAMGLCLLMGYAGQISLGHAAFFAIGGYTSALLTTYDLSNSSGLACLRPYGVLATRQDMYGATLVSVSPWAAFAVAVLLAAAVALLVGWPALHLRGHYLAMATLGFGLIVYRIALGTPVLGAADGITSVPPWDLGAGIVISWRKPYRVANYYVAWTLAMLTLVLLGNIVRSRVGRALRAIHGDEVAAPAMGVDVASYKLLAFVISAVLAAAAGSFLVHYSGGIGPLEAGAMRSVRYVALVAAGGMANLVGVLVISTVLNLFSLRDCFGTLDHAVFGVLLIAIVSLAPEGPLQPLAAGLRAAGRRLRRGGAEGGA